MLPPLNPPDRNAKPGATTPSPERRESEVAAEVGKALGLNNPIAEAALADDLRAPRQYPAERNIDRTVKEARIFHARLAAAQSVMCRLLHLSGEMLSGKASDLTRQYDDSHELYEVASDHEDVIRFNDWLRGHELDDCESALSAVRAWRSGRFDCYSAWEEEADEDAAQARRDEDADAMRRVRAEEAAERGGAA